MRVRRPSRLLGLLGLAFLASHPARADETTPKAASAAPAAPATQPEPPKPAAVPDVAQTSKMPAPPAAPAKQSQALPIKPPPPPVKEMPVNETVAILGQPVVGPLGQVVGRMVDVLVNQEGVPQAAIIDFGGFMGVGSRKIAVKWNTLHFNPGDEKYPVVLDLLPEQLQGVPGYKGETKPAPVIGAPWEANTTSSGKEPGTEQKPGQQAAKPASPGDKPATAAEKIADAPSKPGNASAKPAETAVPAAAAGQPAVAPAKPEPPK